MSLNFFVMQMLSILPTRQPGNDTYRPSKPVPTKCGQKNHCEIFKTKIRLILFRPAQIYLLCCTLSQVRKFLNSRSRENCVKVYGACPIRIFLGTRPRRIVHASDMSFIIDSYLKYVLKKVFF